MGKSGKRCRRTFSPINTHGRVKIIQTSYVVAKLGEKGTSLITKFQIKGLRLRQRVLVLKKKV